MDWRHNKGVIHVSVRYHNHTIPSIHTSKSWTYYLRLSKYVHNLNLSIIHPISHLLPLPPLHLRCPSTLKAQPLCIHSSILSSIFQLPPIHPAHWYTVETFEPKHFVLDCKHFPEKHSGINIRYWSNLLNWSLLIGQSSELDGRSVRLRLSLPPPTPTQ